MFDKQEVSCPVCDSNERGVLYEPWSDEQDPAKLYGAASGVPGTQRIVKCLKCGMIYESPRYDDTVILKGYEHSDESGHDSQYPMRVKSFYKALKTNKKHIPAPSSKVLDIGTAGGAFLDAATQYGYEAHGLEPSHFLVEQGQKRGLNITQGTIENHALENGTFDMVCLWDVIEHLAQPKRALELIRPLLKPDGVILINYPDIGTWQARIAGRRFWWILSSHLHYFTKGTLSQICERTGYETLKFKRYWQILQFGYLQDMAVYYKIPLSALFKRFTPRFIQNISIPYYASQTTFIGKVKP